MFINNPVNNYTQSVIIIFNVVETVHTRSGIIDKSGERTVASNNLTFLKIKPPFCCHNKENG